MTDDAGAPGAVGVKLARLPIFATGGTEELARCLGVRPGRQGSRDKQKWQQKSRPDSAFQLRTVPSVTILSLLPAD